MSVSVPQSYSSFARSSEDRIPNIEAAAQVVPSIALFTLAYWNTLNKSSSGLPRLIHPSCCHLLQPSSAIPCAFLITRSSRPLTRNRPSLAGSPLATTVLLFAFSSLVLLVPHTCVSTCPLPSPLPPSPPTPTPLLCALTIFGLPLLSPSSTYVRSTCSTSTSSTAVLVLHSTEYCSTIVQYEY